MRTVVWEPRISEQVPARARNARGCSKPEARSGARRALQSIGHQVRENVRVEQDDVKRVADQRRLRPGAIDLFDEGADVLVWRHDAGERVRVEGLCTTFPGCFLNRLAGNDAGLTIGGNGALAISVPRGMHFCLQIRPPRRSYHTPAPPLGGVLYHPARTCGLGPRLIIRNRAFDFQIRVRPRVAGSVRSLPGPIGLNETAGAGSHRDHLRARPAGHKAESRGPGDAVSRYLLVNVAIQASGHQYFGSAAKSRQLLVRQRRNVRMQPRREAEARKPPMTAAIGFNCWVVGSACTPKFSSAVAPSR